jgi:hypothetical protein
MRSSRLSLPSLQAVVWWVGRLHLLCCRTRCQSVLARGRKHTWGWVPLSGFLGWGYFTIRVVGFRVVRELGAVGVQVRVRNWGGKRDIWLQKVQMDLTHHLSFAFFPSPGANTEEVLNYIVALG